MLYKLEILDMNHDGVGDEEDCRIISQTPLPLPNIGDAIDVAGVRVKVVNRKFAFDVPNEVLVQVFCEEMKAIR
jgi:hypothetical protein